ncbi:MAG: hypothetical protein ABIQ04_00495 [Candidatus Saccharimonadales bacterium]
MRKTIISVLIVVLVVLLLGNSGILTSLLFFLLVGAVPGTSYAVPSGLMLLIIAVIMWLILLRFAAFGLIRNLSFRRLTKHHLATKKRMPRHRYSQI